MNLTQFAKLASTRIHPCLSGGGVLVGRGSFGFLTGHNETVPPMRVLSCAKRSFRAPTASPPFWPPCPPSPLEHQLPCPLNLRPVWQVLASPPPRRRFRAYILSFSSQHGAILGQIPTTSRPLPQCPPPMLQLPGSGGGGCKNGRWLTSSSWAGSPGTGGPRP